MKLEEYKFKANSWPPPDSCKDKDTYLFGFDEDNQPYIVKWEADPSNKGWVATTLTSVVTQGLTAEEFTAVGDTVTKLIKHWVMAPLTVRAIAKARSNEKDKK